MTITSLFKKSALKALAGAASAIAILALGATSPAPAQAETLTFTAIPDQDATQLRERFGIVSDYLQRELGITVNYIPVKSYAAAVTAFRNDQVQLAWFGALSGVRARSLVPGSQALAQGAEDAAFQSFFIAHESTGLTESESFPKGMAGKTFTFGSKGSTSGRLMPEFHIREAFGKAPEDVFERVGFSGDHSKTVALVESGAYQVGAVNEKVWERSVKEGKASGVRLIWRTPPYPNYQWTIRGDADQRFGKGFTEKVRTVLLSMNDPELLKSFPRSGFIPASNEDYAPIQKTAKALNLID